jgi:hypothetical protein
MQRLPSSLARGVDKGRPDHEGRSVEDSVVVGREVDRVEVPVETLALLAERQLKLGLDIHAHGPE